MRSLSRVLALLFVVFSALSAAQKKPDPLTPPRAVRIAILESLRVPVQKELKTKVVFVVEELHVKDGWAFMKGVPQQPGGKKIDYSKTIYQEAIKNGAFDDWICALLHKVGGKWKVITYRIGATDVPWVEWPKEYKAPSAIFPKPGN